MPISLSSNRHVPGPHVSYISCPNIHTRAFQYSVTCHRPIILIITPCLSIYLFTQKSRQNLHPIPKYPTKERKKKKKPEMITSEEPIMSRLHRLDKIVSTFTVLILC